MSSRRPQRCGAAGRGKRKWRFILGTGLGDLAGEIEADTSIPYREIPNFPRSTALAHKGQLVCGRLAGVPVVAMQGRSHLYEGYQFDDLMLPVRMLCELGVKVLIVSNAAGGVNPRYAVGDVMLIDDHINLMGRPANECPPMAAPTSLPRDAASTMRDFCSGRYRFRETATFPAIAASMSV